MIKIKNYIFVGIFFISLLSFLFFSREILTPFILSLIIAYLLNPIVTYLEKNKNISRGSSSFLLVLLLIVIILTSLLSMAPAIYYQTNSLIDSLPKYINNVVNFFNDKSYANFIKDKFNVNYELNLDFITEKLNKIELSSFVNNFALGVFASSSMVINFVTYTCLAPFLIFYFLRDWKEMLRNINSLLPRGKKREIKVLATKIDKKLNLYLRGQLTICLILGIYYTIAFSFAGLEYGFLIGIISGMITFIPYVGAFTATALSVVTALMQWGFDLLHLSIVAGILVVAQTIEGYILVPNFLGSKLNIHALFILFGMLFFGANFGFVGVIFSVPIITILSVILEYYLARYKRKYC